MRSASETRLQAAKDTPLSLLMIYTQVHFQFPEENQSENQAYSSADDNENGVERRYGENGSDETRREEDAGSSHQDDDLSFWDD